MKSLIFKLLSIGVVAGLVAGCRPKTSEEDAVLFGIVSQQITGLAEGNCAISINHAGLTYGVYVNVAINNGGVLGISSQLAGASAVFASVFGSVAPSQSIELFTLANYEAASGSTIAEQGFSSYANVPYNLKYDAFFTERGAWTAAKRNALLNFSKTFVDSFQIMTGYNSNTASQIVTVVQGGNPTRKAILDGFVKAFLIGAFGQSNVPNCATTADPFKDLMDPNPSNCKGNILNVPVTSWPDSVFGDDPGLNDPDRVKNVVTTLATAMGAVGLQSAVNGTAALACARIPRANCSVRALTTADQKTDIKNATKVVNTLLGNPACPMPNAAFRRKAIELGLKGLKPGTKVNLATGVYEAKSNISDYIEPFSITGIDSSTRILPEKAYPKFGSLVSLGFGNLMPINRTNEKYEITSSNFRFGRNLDAKLVTSCESLGLNVGPSPSVTEPNRQDLTPTQEIAYALSPGGSAASLYKEVGGGDPFACNASFRDQFSIPLALGGGKLPQLTNAPSGNGGATQLLSLCVYGGNATKRGAPRVLLASGLGLGSGASNQISVCGEGDLEKFRDAQKKAATLFEDLGPITTGSDFPNTTNP